MSERAKVNLLPQAVEDLAEIIDFIYEDRPAVAEKMTQRFEQAFLKLSQNPQYGRQARDNRLSLLGYRYLVVSSYLIFYKVHLKTIFVYRILLGARNYIEIL